MLVVVVVVEVSLAAIIRVGLLSIVGVKQIVKAYFLVINVVMVMGDPLI